MIEIPDEGLRIWICRDTHWHSTFQALIVPSEKCAIKGKCPLDKKSCDAQAHRIVREKP